MFCPNCGTKSEPGMKFCEECGCALTENVNIPETDARNDEFQKLPEKNVEPAFVNIPQPEEKLEKSKRGLAVGVVISVVILLIAVVSALFISGVLDFDFSSKENTTQASEKEKEKTETTETTTEEVVEEETTEVDTNAVAKANLAGVWNVKITGSTSPIYSDVYTMTMPCAITFYDNGTYKLYFDNSCYEVMISEMVNEYLEEQGYFDMDDTQKSGFIKEYGFATEEEFYTFVHDEYVKGIPTTDADELIDDLPLPRTGYWAINGDYLYFTNQKTQIDAFNSNPSAYKHDCTKTSLTQGTKDFVIIEGEESFTFAKK